MKKLKNIIQNLLDESENLSDVLFMAGGGGGRKNIKKQTKLNNNGTTWSFSKKGNL